VLGVRLTESSHATACRAASRLRSGSYIRSNPTQSTFTAVVTIRSRGTCG
jgi:hypothetical protein